MSTHDGHDVEQGFEEDEGCAACHQPRRGLDAQRNLPRAPPRAARAAEHQKLAPGPGHLRYEGGARNRRVRGGVERGAQDHAQGIRHQSHEGHRERHTQGRRGLRRRDSQRDRGDEEAAARQRGVHQGVLCPEWQVLHRDVAPQGRRAARRATGPRQLHRESTPIEFPSPHESDHPPTRRPVAKSKSKSKNSLATLPTRIHFGAANRRRTPR